MQILSIFINGRCCRLDHGLTPFVRADAKRRNAADVQAMVLLEGAVNCDGMTPIKTVEVVKILLAGQKDLLPACS